MGSGLRERGAVFKRYTGKYKILYHKWLRHCGTSRKVAGLILDEVIGFFNCPNPFSCIMALGSTQLLTEMSISNLPGGKGQSVRKDDNLTATCEPIV
jgi:hypothetical protein